MCAIGGGIPKITPATRAEKIVNQQKKFSLAKIYTDRYRPGHQEPFRDVIYEWEDQLSASTGLPIVSSTTALQAVTPKVLLKSRATEAALRILDSFFSGRAKSLYFCMAPRNQDLALTSAGVIPVIIDYWKSVDVVEFFRGYRNCPAVLITSLEAFEYLKKNGCPLNLHHFPLSLPDRYRPPPQAAYEKKYDVLFAGRANPVLLEFMRRYAADHPRIEYLFQGGTYDAPTYISSKTGVIGGFTGRPAYMELLKSAKVAFYSTPGIDGGETRTGGMNPVTPRLFELLSAGCHVLARYPDNADTKFFQLQELCPSIESYAAFAAGLTAALNSPPPWRQNNGYLEQHYTSKRGELLQRILHNYN